VVGAEAPHSVLSVPSDDDEESAQRLVRSLGASLANVASNNVYLGRGNVTVILNPDHANLLARTGHDRKSLQVALHEAARQPLDVLRAYMAIPPGDGEMMVVAQPDDILVAVAGDAGLYSVVLPSWGAAAHGNRAVTMEVITDDSCELPI